MKEFIKESGIRWKDVKKDYEQYKKYKIMEHKDKNRYEEELFKYNNKKSNKLDED